MQQKVRKKSAIEKCDVLLHVCLYVCEQRYFAKKETGKSHCPQGILAIANAEGAPMETSWVNYYSGLLLVI